MARLITLAVYVCGVGECSRIANYEIRTNDDRHIGFYCAVHADERLAQANKREEAGEVKP